MYTAFERLSLDALDRKVNRVGAVIVLLRNLNNSLIYKYFNGGPCRDRTYDQLIKRRQLVCSVKS
jgi:hypothetical protein